MTREDRAILRGAAPSIQRMLDEILAEIPSFGMEQTLSRQHTDGEIARIACVQLGYTHLINQIKNKLKLPNAKQHRVSPPLLALREEDIPKDYKP